MGFNIYRHEVLENLRESYSRPERVILSGITGPIAAYAQALYLATKRSEWHLSERELAALVRPGTDIRNTALLFEAGSDQPGHITLYRLVSIRGVSTDDTTEMIVHFKSILANHAPADLAQFRQQFTVPPSESYPDLYENLKLSGGTRRGTWRWMEIEQILNATTLSPTTAPVIP